MCVSSCNAFIRLGLKAATHKVLSLVRLLCLPLSLPALVNGFISEKWEPGR